MHTDQAKTGSSWLFAIRLVRTSRQCFGCESFLNRNDFVAKGEELFVYYGQNYTLQEGTPGYYKRPRPYQAVADDVVQRVLKPLMDK